MSTHPCSIHISIGKHCRCSATAEVFTAFQWVMALSVCLCVLLQSTWPFGKGSRVIIVNYSVKLRVLLRRKQSEWVILSSASCRFSLTTGRRHLVTQDAWNTSRHIYRNCAYTYLLCVYYPISWPFTSSTPLCAPWWELLMSHNEGWSGSTGKLGGEVGWRRWCWGWGQTEKGRKGQEMKNKGAGLLFFDTSHILPHTNTPALPASTAGNGEKNSFR